MFDQLKLQISSWFSGVSPERWTVLQKISLKTAGVLFASYILATIVSSLTAHFIIGMAKPKTPSPGLSSNTQSGLRLSSLMNYRSVKKDVVDRNLFNRDGEVPPEEEKKELGQSESKELSFDDTAPCQKSTLPIDLLGTIYIVPSSSSLATIKEKGYSEADIYREGDSIVGYENALVFKIEMEKVIINNAGIKECIELAPPKFPNGENFAKDNNNSSKGALKDKKVVPASSNCGEITLQESYVSSELGDGFSNILTKGRLIPHNDGNDQMIGFKLIGVDSSSLFGKICLKNGDVITQVNDTSMQQADQGFALYQAFQDERDVRISYLRQGKEAMMVTVKIGQ